ncbi:MAG: PD-(D/E)XK nuclease family protein [Candidatus Pacebacteria bacterium]|nr:PD-(D/E)XK nuclease family protein [Candidatus Paceibacterota bacterium]
MADKYKAIWLSHSSFNDFLSCPKAYYLKNVYKDPKSRNKISLISPYTSLGSAVHLSIETLLDFPSEKRVEKLNTLEKDYEKIWQTNFQGKRGGFLSDEEEKDFFERGLAMIKNIKENPNFLLNKIIKKESYYKGDILPNYFIDSEEEILLCGVPDWVEYLDDDTLHVIDFKTGKNEEKEDSTQLPIYVLLLENLQKRKVSRASYWYLSKDKKAQEKEIVREEVEDIKNKIVKTGKDIKDLKNEALRKDWREVFICKRGEEGCMHCRDYEKIISGEAEYIGKDIYNKDGYILS